MSQEPYLFTTEVVTHRHYNPEYGDDRVCICGHPYYRHFDTYDKMEPVGCKYCCCYEFLERRPDDDSPEWDHVTGYGEE